MNELKIYENPEFGKIRTVAIDGEPWLVGKDVAEVLGTAIPATPFPSTLTTRTKIPSRFPTELLATPTLQ